MKIYKKIIKCLSVLMIGILFLQSGCVKTKAEEEEPDNLYARSCVLMDGSSGRVLFEKNGYEVMPMASTTKIMTLIVALENCNPDEEVEVSAYAASQPKVHLGVHAGQKFVLGDLFYSMMLESHNDSAVIIAEAVGSKKCDLPSAAERTKEESKKAVAAFAKMMNEKARDIGCFNTCFITPNGLDAQMLMDDQSQKIHSTTAADLARILMYCITESVEKERFLQITAVSDYSFSDREGRSYSCRNHNAFLGMMEGALTGKTGFTNQAGYCYVGALQRDGKLFIVALLACGWPNNKTYKWKDTRTLMEYGLANYEYRQVYEKLEDLGTVPVVDGQGEPGEKVEIPLKMEDNQLDVLLSDQEQVDITYDIPKKLKAPVEEGEKVGSVRYSLSGQVLGIYPIKAGRSVEKNSYFWCLSQVGKMFLKKR